MYDCFRIRPLFCQFNPYLPPKCLPYVITKRVLYRLQMLHATYIWFYFERTHVCSVLLLIACEPLCDQLNDGSMAQNRIRIEEKVGQFSD